MNNSGQGDSLIRLLRLVDNKRIFQPSLYLSINYRHMAFFTLSKYLFVPIFL